MALTITIMMIAAKTPYFAFGKATPLILLGLSSSLLLFSDIYIIYKKKGAAQMQRPNFIVQLPVGNITFMIIWTMSFSRKSIKLITFRPCS